MQRLNSWQRRTLALGLLLILLILGYAALIAPVAAISHENQEALDDLERRYVRYRSVLAGAQDLEQRVERLKKELRIQGRFLERDTPALASADLSQLVQDTVSKQGGQILSTQVVPARLEGGFTRVGIKVRIQAHLEALQKVLYVLESSQPVLILDNVQMRPIQQRRRGRDQQTAIELMDVSFEVIGFMRTGGV